MATARELDTHAARAVGEATAALRRGFACGRGRLRDFPATQAAFRELADTLDAEEAVEKELHLREGLSLEEEGSEEEASEAAAAAGAAAEGGGAAGSGGAGPRRASRRVCVMVDGSSQAYAALRWAVGGLVGPGDALWLATVIPWEAFSEDAGRILAEAYDYAHHSGVKARQLHTKKLLTRKNSATGGVGEAVVEFVEGEGITEVVLGSRGLGSVKRSIMGAVGLGSVTDFCITRLRCPMVVVREDGAGAEPLGAPTCE